MAGPPPSLRLTRGWVLRLAGSVLLLGLLSALLPTGEVAAAFARVPPGLLLAVLALFLAGHAVAAAKWWLLLGRGPAFGAVLRAHLAGLAANLCLPGMAGGDLVRAGLVARNTGDLAPVAAAALADRLIDSFGLALLAGAGLLMLGAAAGQGWLVALVAAALALLLAGAFLLLPPAVPALLARRPRLPGAGLALKLAAALGALARRPGRLGLCLLLSMGVQTGFTLLAVWIAGAIGIAAPFGAWLFAWSLAKILAVLPVSLGGLGVREAGLAALMAPFGPAPAAVVAASLLWQAVLVVAGAIGGLVWALTPGGPAAARPGGPAAFAGAEPAGAERAGH
jgi:uncharacterized membrane protein YbhN (UPF0104 family)